MSKVHGRMAFGSIALAALLSVGATAAVEARVLRTGAQAAADNSKQNSGVTRTAQDQPNDKADRLTAAQVRKAIVSDHALSTYAHNIKVIVAGGKVTLEGPVHSEAERQQLLADVASVVEQESIVNKITIL